MNDSRAYTEWPQNDAPYGQDEQAWTLVKLAQPCGPFPLSSHGRERSPGARERKRPLVAAPSYGGAQPSCGSSKISLLGGSEAGAGSTTDAASAGRCPASLP